MKHFYQTRKLTKAALSVFAAGVVLVAGFYACKKPTQGINLIVNTSPLTKSPVLLHFVNANNTSATTLGDFDVTISGTGANLVQMDGGSTKFKASHGFLPLSLISSASPSKASPVKFNVYASIPGFAPISQSISITQDSASVVDISAIEYAHPVNGTSVGTGQSTLTAGVSAGTTVNVAPSGTMVESAVVTIPAGTQMLDASGSPINATQLTTNVVDYSAVSRTSYGAFPGGFSPSNIVDATGNAINGAYGVNFVSAGLLSIKMIAGSTDVKQFSKPVQVSMALDPNTTNFVTGANIKAGDVIPLWSLNEATGQWKSEGNITIVSSGGKLVANFTTTHLSCFNLDWDWAVAGTSFGTCNTPLTVNLHVSGGGTSVYDVALVTPNNQYLGASHGQVISDGVKVVFPSVASIAQAKIVISDFNLYLNPSLPILAQTALFNPCTQGTIDITFQGPPPPEYINVNFNMTAHCSNKNVDVKPSGWFNLYDYGTSLWTYVYMSNGVITYDSGSPVTKVNGGYNIELISGHQYYVETYTDDSYYASAQFTLSKSNFTVPVGAGIAVTGAYSAATSTLTISGTYDGSCN